jgi:urea carboxylase-associated protein 2
MSSARESTVEANRQRYQSLRAAGQGATPRSLPPLTDRNGATIPPEAIIGRQTVPGGWYTTLALRRGEALRLVNIEGAATATIIAWRQEDTSERINAADTVKVQWTASLCRGRVILSDMGRVVFSMIEDTCGAHDVLAGGSRRNPDTNGCPRGQRNTRDNFVAAVGKLGLDRRDIPPSVSFFAPVLVGANGGLAWNAEHHQAGDFVDLRAEMNLLVAISNCAHPLNPAGEVAPGPLDLVRYRAPAAGTENVCRNAGPEAARAFAATDRLFA